MDRREELYVLTGLSGGWVRCGVTGFECLSAYDGVNTFSDLMFNENK